LVSFKLFEFATSIILGSKHYSIAYKDIQKALKAETLNLKNSDRVVSSMIHIMNNEEIIEELKSDVKKILNNRERSVLASEFMKIETEVRKTIYSIIKRNVIFDFISDKKDFEKRIVGIHDGFIIPSASEVSYSESLISEIKDYLSSISVKAKFNLKGSIYIYFNRFYIIFFIINLCFNFIY
jgi:midasin (ATPase involved in ribosome maturation)